MKIAIGLIGNYSDYYKKNNYHGIDIFALTYDKEIEEDPDITQYQYLSFDIIDSTDVELYDRHYQKRKKAIGYMFNMIKNYENKNNIVYDIIIYTSFKDILIQDLPCEKGIYQTYYYGVVSNISEKIVNSIEIISDIIVRINGGGVQNFYEIDDYLFDKLLRILYGNKVIRPCNIEENTKDIVMCVPSVIRPSNNPVDWTGHRTIFSSRERLEQTIKQLKSINDLKKNIQIYLMEGSNITFPELNELSKHSTVLLFVKDEKGNNYSNTHSNKSIYEVYCMKYLFEIIDFKWIFKFGGRYMLYHNFCIDLFLRDKPVFKIIDARNTFTKTENIIECVLYCIPTSYKNNYITIFENIIDTIVNNTSAIENELCKHSLDKYRVEYLNVYGNDATEGFDNLI